MADGDRIRGRCHCGRVTLSVPRAPEWVGSCNCSLCAKTGWLVAYYPDDAVTVEGETVAYIWGDRMIGIHHCPTCGCGTHWKMLGEEQSRQNGTLMETREEGGHAGKEAAPSSSFSRMGVHARMLDGFEVGTVDGSPARCTFDGAPVEVRLFDNRD